MIAPTLMVAPDVEIADDVVVGELVAVAVEVGLATALLSSSDESAKTMLLEMASPKQKAKTVFFILLLLISLREISVYNPCFYILCNPFYNHIF